MILNVDDVDALGDLALQYRFDFAIYEIITLKRSLQLSKLPTEELLRLQQCQEISKTCTNNCKQA